MLRLSTVDSLGLCLAHLKWYLFSESAIRRGRKMRCNAMASTCGVSRDAAKVAKACSQSQVHRHGAVPD